MWYTIKLIWHNVKIYAILFRSKGNITSRCLTRGIIVRSLKKCVRQRPGFLKPHGELGDR